MADKDVIKQEKKQFKKDLKSVLKHIQDFKQIAKKDFEIGLTQSETIKNVITEFMKKYQAQYKDSKDFSSISKILKVIETYQLTAKNMINMKKEFSKDNIETLRQKKEKELKESRKKKDEIIKKNTKAKAQPIIEQELKKLKENGEE